MRRNTAIVCSLVLIHVVMLVRCACVQSPTVDEVGHLPAGLSHWHLGRFELYAVNPPLVRMVAALPVLFMHPSLDWTGIDDRVSLRAEWPIGTQFIRLNRERSLLMFTSSRLAAMTLLIPGMIVIYAWGKETSSGLAGIVAVTIWCFLPSLLGHGCLMTPDAGAASLGLTAMYRFQRWLRISDTFNLALVAATSAGAILTKSTWFVALPIAFLATYVVSFVSADMPRSICRDSLQLMVAGFVSLFLINLAYGFEGTLTRLGELPVISQSLTRRDIPNITPAYSKLNASVLANVPSPLPTSFLQGLDVQKWDLENTSEHRRSYMLGKWQAVGWWYYYLIGFLVKEPIGFQLILYVSIAQGLWNWRRWTQASLVKWSSVIVPPLTVFVIVSGQTGFNSHMRYVLPAYPFLFIIAARTVMLGKFWKWFSYACLTWQAAAAMWFAPHWMSYFNELAGGPKNGHTWLVDSNIDWGQDILSLTHWQKTNREAIPLNFVGLTTFDPADIGLRYQLPAPFVKGKPEITSKEGLRGPQPGWSAVSVCALKGMELLVPEGNGEWSSSTENFTYFLDNFEPVEMIGYSIYIYHITEEDAARVRAKLLAEEAEFLKAQSGNVTVEAAK